MHILSKAACKHKYLCLFGRLNEKGLFQRHFSSSEDEDEEEEVHACTCI